MAKCPRTDCNGTSFRLERIEPTGSVNALQAICCSTCGAVVGVMDYWAVGSIVKKIADHLGVVI